MDGADIEDVADAVNHELEEQIIAFFGDASLAVFCRKHEGAKLRKRGSIKEYY